MRIGVPGEIKVHEYRVALTPGTVRELVQRGHGVIVQTGAGTGVGFEDARYQQAGAEIAPDAAAVWAGADLVVKVKEPQPEEYGFLRGNQMLFTYLHLAAAPALARALQDAGTTALAYETVTEPGGGLPLLRPMSVIAGRLAVQAGAHCLEKAQGGRGVLLGGVPGVAAARVVVLGGGVVGRNATRMALGLEAHVTVIDRAPAVLEAVDAAFGPRVDTVHSSLDAVEAHCRDADLVIGAVLVPGDTAPRLVTRDMVAAMRPGSVLVDVAIDQGGCFETSRPTTHAEPTYAVEGVVHYAVTNMPGAVALTATQALTHATLPYVLALAENTWRDDPHLRAGVNVCAGRITHPAVAHGLGTHATDLESVL